jgi:hypothetical protein
MLLFLLLPTSDICKHPASNLLPATYFSNTELHFSTRSTTPFDMIHSAVQRLPLSLSHERQLFLQGRMQPSSDTNINAIEFIRFRRLFQLVLIVDMSSSGIKNSEL